MLTGWCFVSTLQPEYAYRLVNNSPADRLVQNKSSSTFSVMGSSTPSSTLPAGPSLHARAAAGTAGKTSMKPGSASPSLHAHTAAGRAGKTSMKPGPARPFRAQPGAQRERVVKFGKQRQLQVMLRNKQNKGNLSSQESLLQFLNSLK